MPKNARRTCFLIGGAKEGNIKEIDQVNIHNFENVVNELDADGIRKALDILKKVDPNQEEGIKKFGEVEYIIKCIKLMRDGMSGGRIGRGKRRLTGGADGDDVGVEETKDDIEEEYPEFADQEDLKKKVLGFLDILADETKEIAFETYGVKNERELIAKLFGEKEENLSASAKGVYKDIISPLELDALDKAPDFSNGTDAYDQRHKMIMSLNKKIAELQSTGKLKATREAQKWKAEPYTPLSDATAYVEYEGADFINDWMKSQYPSEFERGGKVNPPTIFDYLGRVQRNEILDYDSAGIAGDVKGNFGVEGSKQMVDTFKVHNIMEEVKKGKRGLLLFPEHKTVDKYMVADRPEVNSFAVLDFGNPNVALQREKVNKLTGWANELNRMAMRTPQQMNAFFTTPEHLKRFPEGWKSYVEQAMGAFKYYGLPLEFIQWTDYGRPMQLYFNQPYVDRKNKTRRAFVKTRVAPSTADVETKEEEEVLPELPVGEFETDVAVPEVPDDARYREIKNEIEGNEELQKNIGENVKKIEGWRTMGEMRVERKRSNEQKYLDKLSSPEYSNLLISEINELKGKKLAEKTSVLESITGKPVPKGKTLEIALKNANYFDNITPEQKKQIMANLGIGYTEERSARRGQEKIAIQERERQAKSLELKAQAQIAAANEQQKITIASEQINQAVDSLVTMATAKGMTENAINGLKKLSQAPTNNNDGVVKAITLNKSKPEDLKKAIKLALLGKDNVAIKTGKQIKMTGDTGVNAILSRVALAQNALEAIKTKEEEDAAKEAAKKLQAEEERKKREATAVAAAPKTEKAESKFKQLIVDYRADLYGELEGAYYDAGKELTSALRKKYMDVLNEYTGIILSDVIAPLKSKYPRILEHHVAGIISLGANPDNAHLVVGDIAKRNKAKYSDVFNDLISEFEKAKPNYEGMNKRMIVHKAADDIKSAPRRGEAVDIASAARGVLDMLDTPPEEEEANPEEIANAFLSKNKTRLEFLTRPRDPHEAAGFKRIFTNTLENFDPLSTMNPAGITHMKNAAVKKEKKKQMFNQVQNFGDKDKWNNLNWLISYTDYLSTMGNDAEEIEARLDSIIRELQYGDVLQEFFDNDKTEDPLKAMVYLLEDAFDEDKGKYEHANQHKVIDALIKHLVESNKYTPDKLKRTLYGIDAILSEPEGSGHFGSGHTKPSFIYRHMTGRC